MQLLRVIVLTLIALGMQVPGGLAFELCLCQGISSLFHRHGEGSGASCCGFGRDHCAGGEGTSANDTEHATRDSGDESCDGCIKLTTAKHTPSNSPARNIIADLPATSTLLQARVIQLGSGVFLPRVNRLHDPPGRRRNLPLVI